MYSLPLLSLYTDLKLGLKFSLRNGFGPVPPVVEVPSDTSSLTPNERYDIALQNIMAKLTVVEEAAIRRIAPLLHIVRLAHGNIGATGNTSCVWQDTSRLSRTLPNLPEECKFVIVTRPGSGDSQMKSTKFNRNNIRTALTLLKKTGLEPWKDIDISTDNLDQWPEEGDLADLLRERGREIPEVDEEGRPLVELQEDENEQASAAGVPVLGDGADTGPAPLQNTVVPIEEFEGVMDAGGASNVNARNAIGAAAAIQDAVERIRDTTTDADPQPQFNSDRTTATFAHRDVLPTGDFVDMNSTKYAWSLAFPTLFVPRYTSIDGSNEKKWRIFHDPTGWDSPRDKPVDPNKWYEHQMWRSDGAPAAHPTFALVAYNHKMKNQLRGQARYAVSISGIDPNITCEEIRNASDAGVRNQVDKLMKQAKCSQVIYRVLGNTGMLQLGNLELPFNRGHT